MTEAMKVRVEGVVQGVGFRPFVYTLAKSHNLSGWVLNDEQGVEIFLEGARGDLDAFLASLSERAPQAARLDDIKFETVAVQGFSQFEIVESRAGDRITTRISPDLSVCSDCLADLNNPADFHYEYPYVNCTNCGPRFSIIRALPYDRSATTMAAWKMCERCRQGYENPLDRRFHAQPVACGSCGPGYFFQNHGSDEKMRGVEGIKTCVEFIKQGKIVAVKGIGGYHLVLDASNREALKALRERKFRRDKPFALMVADLDLARELVELSDAAASALAGVARPILLAAQRQPAHYKRAPQLDLTLIAPDNGDLGLMLPYTPLHHLLFKYGAPPVLVMTSANRSSEPIAFEDEQAKLDLFGIADGYLIGERPIHRRMDDSVLAVGSLGVQVVRRGRGLAPDAVVRLPVSKPVLALGADLKNTITLCIDGQCFVSQYIGDLEHESCYQAFQATAHDFLSMYNVASDQLTLVFDQHPQYLSSRFADQLEAAEKISVQHHRAHIASVLAEHKLYDEPVLGLAFDGTGYGDDGSIWGGEFLKGSLKSGFERVANLAQTRLVGGDAAAKWPLQALAGFLCELKGLEVDFSAAPFNLPEKRFRLAMQLAEKNLRCFPTTSVGRLFDAAAALCGFNLEQTFEAQAAIWLEHQGRLTTSSCRPYPFVFDKRSRELRWQAALTAMVSDRIKGRAVADLSRSFHLGLAVGAAEAAEAFCREYQLATVVLSGGVMQNLLLLEHLEKQLLAAGLRVLVNRRVPANDGGISLGQAALAAFRT